MKSSINISSREWDLIETWLNQVDVQEKAPMLNEQLTQIPDIAKKIEHVKKIREEIEDSIRQSKIKEFHHNIPNSSDNPDDYREQDQVVSIDKKESSTKSITTKKTKSKEVWYAAAAVLVALIGIYWMMAGSNTSEKTFAENFRPDIGLPLKMDITNAHAFYEGMLDYKQENYKDAIEKWEVLLKTKPENDTLNYFIGVAHLALGNAPKSLVYLEHQERFHQGIFKEDAAWYAALAKIKEGKFEEAGRLLQKYPSARNTNLLNKLDEL